MRRILIILLFPLTIISCRTDKQNEPTKDNASKDKDYITVPFDTTQVLAELNIIENIDKHDLIYVEAKKGLKDKLDTIELMYIAYACDCQKWVDPTEYHRVRDHNYGDRDDPGEDYIEFDLDKFGFYIEPADQQLEIANNAHVTGNIVKFIGKEYKDKGHPENPDFIMRAPKGKVFRYYTYEIQRPFRIWGPCVYEGADSVTGEKLFVPNMLTIKND